MTTKAIKTRFTLTVAIVTAICSVLFFSYMMFEYSSIQFTTIELNHIRLLQKETRDLDANFKKVTSIINSNKLIKKEYDFLATRYLIDSKVEIKNLESIMQEFTKKYSFVENISVSFIPNEKYINAANVSLNVHGLPSTNQSETDYAVASLLKMFIAVYKKEFCVYQDSLHVEENTGLITYLYYRD